MTKQDLPNWFRTRSYIHFDSKLTERSFDWISKFVTNPAKVGAHPFYPFLTYDKPKFKIEPGLDGKRTLKYGTRPICYAAHLDAQIYSYYSHKLSAIYEQRLAESNLAESVIGFRKLKTATGDSKCNIHLAREAFEAIGQIGNCEVYAFDIKAFFTSLDSRILKKAWCDLIQVENLPKDHFNVFKNLRRYRIVQRDLILEEFRIPKSSRKQKIQGCRRIGNAEIFRRDITQYISTVDAGIPQGSPISAVLANIYMLTFDRHLAESITREGGRYFRYCDDLLIIKPSAIEVDVSTVVEHELNLIGLKLNPAKTHISNFYADNGEVVANKPIQYLGFIFDGKVISVRPGAISTYRRNLKLAVNRSIILSKRNIKNGGPAFKQQSYIKSILKHYSPYNDRTFLFYLRRGIGIINSRTLESQYRSLCKHFDSELSRAKFLSEL